MPAHPTLAAILAEWKLSGWAAMMGRQPTPDDLIAPMPPADALRRKSDWTPEGMRNKSFCFKRFREDLERLGFRHRRGHACAARWVSLGREDGARKDILELCTHNPKKTGSSIDVYTTFPWEALCGEVAKLRIQRRTPENIVALRAAVAATSPFDGDPPEPEPPAPLPRTGGPRNRDLARSLATPLPRGRALDDSRRRTRPPPAPTHVGANHLRLARRTSQALRRAVRAPPPPPPLLRAI